MKLEVPLVLCHEGGYSPEMVPFCGHAVIEALSGIRVNHVIFVDDILGASVDIIDPFTEEIDCYAYQELQVSHRLLIYLTPVETATPGQSGFISRTIGSQTGISPI